jgi:hypothetical protein
MVGQIHHGADDNASGTAGVLELARSITAATPRPRRSILFMTYSGEELGLLGSAYYVEHPMIPLSRVVAMLNLDMIGRLKQNKLYVGGIGTSPGFRSILDEENQQAQFEMDYSDSGYDASDHMSFARKEIPVMFFFSGLHPDYHKPTDTWDKMEADSTARILKLTSRIVERIDANDERPAYSKPADNRRRAAAEQGGGGGEEGGYGPYFGSIPDFAEVKGVKFADVREGSPAGLAGLKAGDIMTEFDGKPILNLYDFTYALRAKKADDEVVVVVTRGAEQVRAKVKLGRRQ